MDKKAGNNNEKQEVDQTACPTNKILKNENVQITEKCDILQNGEGMERISAGIAKMAAVNGEAIKLNEEVFLRVYDLSNGAAKVFSKQFLGFEIDGIWHTSIEIYGKEYYFQNGLVAQMAGSTPYGPFVERISLGHTDCSKENLEEYFEASRHHWTPESYDLFENNCNNFSNDLAEFLLEKGIPSHILELPERVKKSPFFQQLFGGRRNK